MGHEQEEFAEFYRASKDSCLKAVTAVAGDCHLAEELVAEAAPRPTGTMRGATTRTAPRCTNGWTSADCSIRHIRR
jgi:hypothetical protein